MRRLTRGIRNRNQRGIFSALLITALTMSPIFAAEHEPKDFQVMNAVEDQLLRDPGIESNQVDVKAANGIVTLSGTVDNLLAKERAVKVAETVKGVRSIVNRITIDPGMRNDREIRSDIITALLNDPATESWEVQVKVDHGTATLEGTVDSWHEKQLAALVAKGVSGVTGLQNDLNLNYQSERTDAEIRAEIRQSLYWNALVDDNLIQLSVNDGVVHLSGTVGSAAEKSKSISDAWVAGVKEVNSDDLQVKWWARDERLRAEKYQDRSDEEIEEAVRAAFLRDPRVLSFDVNVDVAYGRATLTGTVDNLKAKRAAAQDARNTVGVWGIKNLIKVRTDEFNDSKIARNIRSALERDPYVERYEVAVMVIDGTAYLSGAVDTAFEKAQAEDVTSRVRGVHKVHNNLSITGNDWLSYNPYTYLWRPYDYGWYEYSDTTTMADWEIALEIRDELFWSPFVDEDQVEVSVENGIATLTGEVDSWNEFQFAAENAREGGAIAVVNNLEVDYGPSS